MAALCRTRSLVTCLGLLAFLAGCSDEETAGPEGTSVAFAADADFTDPARFYDFPFPSDHRLLEDGSPDFRGFPYPVDNAAMATTLPGAMARPGFAVSTTTYFRFDGPMPAVEPYDVYEGGPADVLHVVDIDPDSPERGRFFPAMAYRITPGAYAPENLVGVAPHPGAILRPATTYGVVIRRGFGDASGAPLGVAEGLAGLREGQAPPGGDALVAQYQPLWQVLGEAGVDAGDVAAASVFTTGDVAAQTAAWAEAAVEAHDVTIEGLALDPDDGADHPRFCELHGTVTLPQFQRGTAPFPEDGEFVVEDGVPQVQRDEVVPIAITVPKEPMPDGGYPLMLYIHGSGGLFTQGVDRGALTEPGGEPTKGEGPAHVVAEHGFATAGAGMPVSPDRVEGVGSFDYVINLTNIDIFASNFRQGAIEQRLILEALSTLTIDPTALEGCAGPALPTGETAYRFDTSQLAVMGQSMGAQYANIVAAIDPTVKIVVPTGAGGPWTLMFKDAPLFGGLDEIVGSIAGIDPSETYFAHPALNLIQHAWEPGDAYPYVPHIARRPFEGHPSRHIYTSAAPGDEFWSFEVYDAMAMAYGNQQVGEPQWPATQERLALVGRDGIAPYPVSQNRTSEDGTPFTGVLVQYESDGIGTPHSISTQLDSVKYQYGCFLQSFVTTGEPTVPAPAPLGTPCP